MDNKELISWIKNEQVKIAVVHPNGMPFIQPDDVMKGEILDALGRPKFTGEEIKAMEIILEWAVDNLIKDKVESDIYLFKLSKSISTMRKMIGGVE